LGSLCAETYIDSGALLDYLIVQEEIDECLARCSANDTEHPEGDKVMAKLPNGKEITRQATCLGMDVRQEYITLREGYKSDGLTAKEAYTRAYIELKISERYEDWRSRKSVGEIVGKNVPLTPKEVQEVIPTYRPRTITNAESVGDSEMSFAEQVIWARDWSAKVQNGDPTPKRFPNDGALFQFQSAISNRRDFEKLVAKVEGPNTDGEDAYLQDGQHMLRDIEGQIREAVKESGERLVELETDFTDRFRELFQGVLN
jgi:hypothetical protein